MEEKGGKAARPRGWVSNDPADRRKCNKAVAHTGRCAYQLVGPADAAVHELRQTMVGLVGQAGRRLTLAAWARGKKVPPEARPEILIELRNAGPIVKRSRLLLATGSYAYTRFARSFGVHDTYDEARIRIRYDGGSGKLLVDDVSLGVK
jgi:hypothetical protein